MLSGTTMHVPLMSPDYSDYRTSDNAAEHQREQSTWVNRPTRSCLVLTLVTGQLFDSINFGEETNYLAAVAANSCLL